MGRATLILNSRTNRDRAHAFVKGAPNGTRVTFNASKRSIPQNDRMWAMLTDVSEQLEWHGVKLKAEDWKLVFMDALNREVRMVPNIEGTGFVNIGTRSSDLSKEEMSDLIELIFAFGAKHGVTLEPAFGPEYRSQYRKKHGVTFQES
jgi:hypothetical protein